MLLKLAYTFPWQHRTKSETPLICIKEKKILKIVVYVILNLNSKTYTDVERLGEGANKLKSILHDQTNQCIENYEV